MAKKRIDTKEAAEEIMSRIDWLTRCEWSQRKIQHKLQEEGWGWIGKNRFESLAKREPRKVAVYLCPECRQRVTLYPCLICSLRRRRKSQSLKVEPREMGKGLRQLRRKHVAKGGHLLSLNEVRKEVSKRRG